MKQFYKETIAVIVILILGIIFQKNYINEFPSHIHAWAQSDRYAIALRFTENNLNFFKPETYIYNHQFPHDMQVPAKETITAVDFPIHDYIPAVIMKISGNKSPWIFRLYILLYSFIGLFYLFKSANILTRDFLKSIFVVIVAATSPVFVYYQAGFLPTIPSLSNTFVGVYFYILHLQTEKRKYFNLTIFFTTLAALSRTTFAIPLIAIFCYEFLRVIKRETPLKQKIFPVLFSITAIAAYFFYNGYLRNNYGSIFLNHILPATSFQRVLEIIETVNQNWGTQYFSTIQYVAFLFLLALFILAAIVNKVKIYKNTRQFLMLTLIIIIGCILFALLMLRQFPAHDYYFLDTFFLPILMLLVFILSVVPNHNNKWRTSISIIVVMVISFSMVNKALDSQRTRREIKPWDKTTSTINNFMGSEKYLDSLGISPDAKMLVIDAQAPNIPFILMNRKGYAVMSNNQDSIENTLDWDYDYIVTQNDFLRSELYSIYPEIISKLNRNWNNGKISINSIRKDTTKQEIYEYLGLDKQISLFEEILDFEKQPNKNWNNFIVTTENCYSGKNSGILTSDKKYGLTFISSSLSQLMNKERLLLFQSYFLQHSINNIKLVVTISENGELTHYETVDLKTHIKKINNWEQISLLFTLPKVNSDDSEFRLYLMNSDNSEIYFDDFGFKIY